MVSALAVMPPWFSSPRITPRLPDSSAARPSTETAQSAACSRLAPGRGFPPEDANVAGAQLVGHFNPLADLL